MNYNEGFNKVVKIQISVVHGNFSPEVKSGP